MPYIKRDERAQVDRTLANVLDFVRALGQDFTTGNLNYVITRIVTEFWHTDPHYATLAAITGVLENVKQEFYRRVAEPYEDQKRAENGDVY